MANDLQGKLIRNEYIEIKVVFKWLSAKLKPYPLLQLLRVAAVAGGRIVHIVLKILGAQLRMYHLFIFRHFSEVLFVLF